MEEPEISGPSTVSGRIKHLDPLACSGGTLNNTRRSHTQIASSQAGNYIQPILRL
jgi:hypothetical protein